MPYIAPNDRPAIDEKIEDLIAYLKSRPVENQDGDLNYALSRIIHEVYPARYFHYNRALGVLSAIQLELYRRKVTPYEDTKIAQNGDV